MWVFTQYGFISIVVDKKNDNNVLIRARNKTTLPRLFAKNGCKLSVQEHTPNSDYQYRVSVPRTALGILLYREVSKLDYTNFKEHIQNRDYKRLLMEIWVVVKLWYEG